MGKIIPVIPSFSKGFWIEDGLRHIVTELSGISRIPVVLLGFSMQLLW